MYIFYSYVLLNSKYVQIYYHSNECNQTKNKSINYNYDSKMSCVNPNTMSKCFFYLFNLTSNIRND